MNLLHSNDRAGQYPQSWYAATATPLEPFAPLRGETRADVCIIGGGFTGLSAALHLAEAGRDVVLLDAHRVGFGASGRNGGQLGSGQRVGQRSLEKMVGQEDAAKLWEQAQAAKALVRSLVDRHKIECHLKPGIAHACFSEGDMRDEHEDADHLRARYGYDQIETLGAEAFRALVPSPTYHGGSLDRGAGHLHPLAFALGLARAAVAAGVRIYERSEVHHIQPGATPLVQTDAGRVTCDHLILACNGYLGGLERKVAARVMPINNFVVATEPLGADAKRILTQDIAVADSKFVVNYYRLSHDNRLLFGGGESYGYKFPSDIKQTVRKPMLQIYPDLRDVAIDYAWGGTLAITMKRMPYLTRVSDRVLSASGYSGHGVGNATHAGKLMAEVIAGHSDGFDTMSRVPSQPFPGGPSFRSPLLALAMTWYATRDRLGL